MLPYTREEILAFDSSTQKQLVLTFSDGTVITNEDIESESMSLEQSICEDEQLTFGQVSASCFKVRLLGVAKSYKNLTVIPTISATYYDDETGETTTFTRQLGKYKVYSDTATSNRLSRDLECYDLLYEVLDTDYTDWHNSQDFPMTVKSYRDAFFQHVGIEQADITYQRSDGSYSLPNDDMVIEKNFIADGYSGSDLLNSLCEINGCFGHIDFDGKFKYVIIQPEFRGLYPSDDLFPSDTIYPIDADISILDAREYVQGSLKYEEFETKNITQLQVRMTENDIGAVVGGEGNTYIIENNPLLYGKTSEQLTEIANNIFAVIRLPHYTPASVKLPCAPWYELGDCFKILSESSSIIICVLHRTITGITALFDTFECEGVEYYSERANGVNRNIDILKQYTNELSRTVEQTQSTITEMTEAINGEFSNIRSQITQTADAITSEVQRASSAESDLSTKITQTVESISLEVQDDGSSSSIQLKLGETILSSGKITLSGYVTFTDLSDPNSKTTIDGNLIKTGTIDASKATITNINADNITSGSISADKIKGGQLTIDTASNTTKAIVINRSNTNYMTISPDKGIVIHTNVHNTGVTVDNGISVGDKTVIDSGGVKVGGSWGTQIQLTSKGFKVGYGSSSSDITNPALEITAEASSSKIIVGKSYLSQVIITNTNITMNYASTNALSIACSSATNTAINVSSGKTSLQELSCTSLSCKSGVTVDSKAYTPKTVYSVYSGSDYGDPKFNEVKKYSLNNTNLWAVNAYSAPSMYRESNGRYTFSSNPSWTKISLSESSYSTKIYGISGYSSSYTPSFKKYQALAQ